MPAQAQQQVAHELRRWVRGGGQMLPGLVARRSHYGRNYSYWFPGYLPPPLKKGGTM